MAVRPVLSVGARAATPARLLYCSSFWREDEELQRVGRTFFHGADLLLLSFFRGGGGGEGALREERQWKGEAR